ncbi:MAG: glycerol-3-phosphate 1-O-acyltransferase PlsY [Eubacteriales bacterium]|nr:glycerol-3-phosphate 1-O-acyltransferase PlsY [Eubacteriales bacterium]MDY3332402.1 glycerol-3-phosphate 1-O-acyltransferase PlsY [Gallibacter sp.]
MNIVDIFSIGAIIISYFIGNISPAILIAKAKGVDIRSVGSKNAGTTNVLRTIGKKYAVITLLIDVIKGVVPVYLASITLGEKTAAMCMAAVLLGHIWPALFNYRGGKGVATAFGGLLAFYYPLGLIALGMVVLGIVLTKKMSVGTIFAATSFPIFVLLMKPEFTLWALALALLILFKHRQNIQRLINGTEPNLGKKIDK